MFVPNGPIKKYSSFGFDNGWRLVRQQAIVLPNDG